MVKPCLEDIEYELVKEAVEELLQKDGPKLQKILESR